RRRNVPALCDEHPGGARGRGRGGKPYRTIDQGQKAPTRSEILGVERGGPPSITSEKPAVSDPRAAYCPTACGGCLRLRRIRGGFGPWCFGRGRAHSRMTEM